MSFIVLVIYSFVSWCWQQKKKHVEWIPSMSLHIPCTQWKPNYVDQVTECHRHLFSSCINGKNMRLGEKCEKRVLLSPLMDKNYLCLMLVNYRDLPYAICYFYLPKVWQWRHINDETFPVLQRFCQHKSSGNAHMWQQFAVLQFSKNY